MVDQKMEIYHKSQQIQSFESSKPGLASKINRILYSIKLITDLTWKPF